MRSRGRTDWSKWKNEGLVSRMRHSSSNQRNVFVVTMWPWNIEWRPLPEEPDRRPFEWFTQIVKVLLWDGESNDDWDVLREMNFIVGLHKVNHLIGTKPKWTRWLQWTLNLEKCVYVGMNYVHRIQVGLFKFNVEIMKMNEVGRFMRWIASNVERTITTIVCRTFSEFGRPWWRYRRSHYRDVLRWWRQRTLPPQKLSTSTLIALFFHRYTFIPRWAAKQRTPTVYLWKQTRN